METKNIPKELLRHFYAKDSFTFDPVYLNTSFNPTGFHKKNKHWTVVYSGEKSEMEQKRVSAQPTRSLSFHLPLSVTGISSFEAMLELPTWYTQSWVIIFELKGPTFSCFYIFWWSSKYFYAIMNYQPSQKVIF